MYEPILHALRGNVHDEAIAGARELLMDRAGLLIGAHRLDQAMAEPFAMLRPVSMRLGYPES